MTHSSRFIGMAGWAAPVGWLGAAVLLGLWIDPRIFAWGTAACVLLAFVGHLATRHHTGSSVGIRRRHVHEQRRLPSWRQRTFLTLLLFAVPALAQPSATK